ncbi:MAG: flippase-like domain-containing protein [Magnetococcales bacterium]|nr:flippase-like domain-containing protein [Magnetococcales bacterium]
MREHLGRRLMPFFKFIVAGLLVGYLWNQGKLDFAALSVLLSAPWGLLGMMFLCMLGYSLTAYRWILLLRAVRIRLPCAWGQMVTYIGIFSNLFLPGGNMAGDAVRLAYVARCAPGHRPEALISLFMDRVVGLYAMLVICMASILINLDAVLRVPVLQGMALAVFAIVLGAPPLGLLFLRLARGNAWLQRMISAPDPGRLARILIRLNEIIRLYGHSIGILILVFFLSLLAQGLLLFVLILVGMTLGLGGVGPADQAFATVWAWIANFIPLTPGGIGVGEAAFDHICRMLESVPSGVAYGTIFLVFRMIGILAGLPGLPAYLFFRNDIDAIIAESEGRSPR